MDCAIGLSDAKVVIRVHDLRYDWSLLETLDEIRRQESIGGLLIRCERACSLSVAT